MAISFKEYCELHNTDADHVMTITLGDGGKYLPTPSFGFVGYFAQITETCLACSDGKQTMSVEIPFAAFSRAEFGIGNGNLWLQCIVDGVPFVFSATRGAWKGAAGKLLLQRIEAVTPLIDKKLYDGYTGKLYLWYMFKP